MFFFKKKQITDYNALYQKIKENLSSELIEKLEEKWGKNFKENKFTTSYIKNPEVIKSNDIKIINMGALKDFSQWLNQIVILPPKTTIYITPFFKRDFECEYFIKSFEADEKLKDEKFGLSAKEQVQAFIFFAQMAGHPVICDFLTVFSRYADPILEKPYLVRWIDTKYAQEKIFQIIDTVSSELEKEFEKDDIQIIKEIYQQESKGVLSSEYDKIYKEFSNKVLEKKKELSKEFYKKDYQIKIQKRIKNCNAQDLIAAGIWSIPCTADNSSFPIFDYMNKNENYPVFKHFDAQNTNISDSVKNDFQTPAYFMDTESEQINKDVLKYFIELSENLIEDYNFDGFKINNTKNIFLSEIGDKIPLEFLKNLNCYLKKKNIALIAEANFNKEDFERYQNLGFDILWDKYENLSPQELLDKYSELTNYNLEDFNKKNLSVTKIYNDIFGEESHINTYPSQLGKSAALFRWFSLNFLPVGKNATLPIVYLDGDETFTEKGFVKTIYKYSEFERGTDNEFYNSFKAISDFAKTSKIINGGEAAVINQDDDGFVCWMISKEPLKEILLIAANYKPKEEYIILQNDSEKIKSTKENEPVINKMISIPGECKVVNEFILDKDSFIKKDFDNNSDLLEFEVIKPSEFRIFLLRK